MTSEWNTRHTLIQRAQNSNDKETWDEFADFYQKFIFYILHKMNVSSNIVDDLAQEVLFNLWNKLDSYVKDKGSFRGWLTRVIRNTAIDNLIKEGRYNRRQQDVSDALQIMRSFSESEFEKIIEREWRTHLGNIALERIKKVFTGNGLTVFTMSLEGASNDEIAEQLGIKKDTVYTLRTRAKKHFTRELKILMNEFEF